MPIYIPQFKYNIRGDFNSADKTEELANHIFNDTEEYEKDVQIQLQRREQITELKTRIASLKELGATINYSKYTALSKKLAELEKIERSQPQISEYIRPIPLPSEYAEKPKPSNVNTPIPVFEIPNSNSSPVRQNSTNEIKSNTHAEDLKLPIGITVGALSLVTLFAIGLSNLPKSEKVAVNTQPVVESQPFIENKPEPVLNVEEKKEIYTAIQKERDDKITNNSNYYNYQIALAIDKYYEVDKELSSKWTREIGYDYREKQKPIKILMDRNWAKMKKSVDNLKQLRSSRKQTIEKAYAYFESEISNNSNLELITNIKSKILNEKQLSSKIEVFNVPESYFIVNALGSKICFKDGKDTSIDTKYLD